MSVSAATTGAAAAQATHRPVAAQSYTNRYTFTLEGKDYPTHLLGGPGLYPSRRYAIAYGTLPICKEVRDALNRALADPRRSETNVIREIPPEIVAQDTSLVRQLTYEGKNPLYADRLFVSWNYLNQPPHYLDKDQGRIWDGLFYDRWLIAPVLNDGKPVLVVNMGRGGAYPWLVAQDELAARNWSDWKSYQPFTPFPNNECPDTGDPRAVFDRLRKLCAFRDSRNWFPKLSIKAQQRPPWYSVFRAVAVLNFAHLGSRFYPVLHIPNWDVVIVTDTLRPVGDDLCYLVSSRRH